jgi:mannose/cellobiose epimerase-like protein (N-acyl-D-glucosamine 2-epimerase family)
MPDLRSRSHLDRLFRDLLHATERFVPPAEQWTPQARLDEKADLILVARMTHTFARALPFEHPRSREIASTGLDAIATTFEDADHGGWLARPGAPRKRAYEHAFVLLAGASTARSDDASLHPAGLALIARAREVIDEHFWDDDLGVLRQSFAADWSDNESYIGANANMHAVEAHLAAGAATGDTGFVDRALRIAEAIVHRQREAGHPMLIEHFTPTLEPLLDFGRDAPGDGLRPPGSTFGHWFEWSRLLLELDDALDAPPSWLAEAATGLYDDAVRIGWALDGTPGFPYNIDWDGSVIVDTRLHWVLCEAIAAAEALFARTGSRRYADDATRFWVHATESFIRPDGSWISELDSDLKPAQRVWNGRPDAYHASTALLAGRTNAL